MRTVLIFVKHQQYKVLHPVPKEVKKYLTEAGTIDDVSDNHPTAVTKKARKLKDNCKRG